jgi:hypothetical protein
MSFLVSFGDAKAADCDCVKPGPGPYEPYINQANGYVGHIRARQCCTKGERCGPTQCAPVIAHVTAGSLTS